MINGYRGIGDGDHVVKGVEIVRIQVMKQFGTANREKIAIARARLDYFVFMLATHARGVYHGLVRRDGLCRS